MIISMIFAVVIALSIAMFFILSGYWDNRTILRRVRGRKIVKKVFNVFEFINDDKIACVFLDGIFAKDIIEAVSIARKKYPDRMLRVVGKTCSIEFGEPDEKEKSHEEG